jgi:hypothetical protein
MEKPPFSWGEFRDIAEYRTAFSERRPQSHPETRPWLEARLSQDQPPVHPSSQPTQSLFHWIESTAPHGTAPSGTAKFAVIAEDNDEFEEDLGSPYICEFRHSKSLDFGALDGIESFNCNLKV